MRANRKKTNVGFIIYGTITLSCFLRNTFGIKCYTITIHIYPNTKQKSIRYLRSNIQWLSAQFADFT